MRPGELVGGRFRIEHRIGAGGMGVVFRAHDDLTGRRVAIKVLDATTALDLERARREAAALAALSSPAIVAHVADGMIADGRVYLAMEWIDGITLEERLTEAGCSVREAIAVARQIAGALAAAHAAGVLHRDVKPSNVLLVDSQVDQVKLIDFGVARVAGVVGGLTRTGTAIGTPGYMAPEQARGDKQLAPAADVFALGCVLYECLTGRPAFSGSHRAAVMTKILYADPPPLFQSCPDAPPGVARALDRMLTKAASARLTDGAAVVAELDQLAPVPDGPRRSSRELVHDLTLRGVATAARWHVVVLASRGAPDDVLEPPAEDERVRAGAAAARAVGDLEVLATGAMALHLHGARDDIVARAHELCAELRAALPGWVVAMSPVETDVGSAADHGTEELAVAAMAAIFARR